MPLRCKGPCFRAPLLDTRLKERVFYWSSVWHLICCLPNNGKHAKYETDYINLLHALENLNLVNIGRQYAALYMRSSVVLHC